jgi:methylphosphotriester-DNA--protein-cysteine methyltransferase
VETILNNLLILAQKKLEKGTITTIAYVEGVKRLNEFLEAIEETCNADPTDTRSKLGMKPTNGSYSELFEEILTLCQNHLRADEITEEQYTAAMNKLNEFASLNKFTYKADPHDFRSMSEDDDDSYTDDSYGSDSY